MAFKKGQNPNHPKIGSAIRVEPIRDLNAIAAIKKELLVQDNLRDYCLFTMGINMAWRANELLSLKVGHVCHLKAWDELSLKQSKNQKYRMTTINQKVADAIYIWLSIYKSGDCLNAPLFPSRKGGVLTVPTVCGKVKKWCSSIGQNGNFGSHTLRKTWGYHQRVTFEAPLPLLVKSYGHSSERQTLDYLGIQPCEIADLFRHEL